LQRRLLLACLLAAARVIHGLPSCRPPHAGGPADNETYFCEGTGTFCFSLNATADSWGNQEAACAAGGGHLVMYDSPGMQLLVEKVFSSLADYWVGLKRASGKPYVFTTGNEAAARAPRCQLEARQRAPQAAWKAAPRALRSSRRLLHLRLAPWPPAGDSVTQVVSNSDTYAHWSWQHHTAKGVSGNDCAYASNTYQYDYFLGDNQNTSQTGSSSFFQTSSADLKNGWTAAACAGTKAAVCIFSTSIYPCGPPPSPPPPPPRPPSPPSPPQATSCKRLPGS
jgi:hypothetical protein